MKEQCDNCLGFQLRDEKISELVQAAKALATGLSYTRERDKVLALVAQFEHKS